MSKLLMALLALGIVNTSFANEATPPPAGDEVTTPAEGTGEKAATDDHGHGKKDKAAKKAKKKAH